MELTQAVKFLEYVPKPSRELFKIYSDLNQR